MNIQNNIYDLLKRDYPLRMKIADSLHLQAETVKLWAYRKQSARIGHYMVVNIIKEHTGLTDADIFETESDISVINKIQSSQLDKVVAEGQKIQS